MDKNTSFDNGKCYLIQVPPDSTTPTANLEIFQDPDIGLELREDFAHNLQHSLETFQTKAHTAPAEDVAAELGLDW